MSLVLVAACRARSSSAVRSKGQRHFTGLPDSSHLPILASKAATLPPLLPASLVRLRFPLRSSGSSKLQTIVPGALRPVVSLLPSRRACKVLTLRAPSLCVRKLHKSASPHHLRRSSAPRPPLLTRREPTLYFPLTAGEAGLRSRRRRQLPLPNNVPFAAAPLTFPRSRDGACVGPWDESGSELATASANDWVVVILSAAFERGGEAIG